MSALETAGNVEELPSSGLQAAEHIHNALRVGSAQSEFGEAYDSSHDYTRSENQLDATKDVTSEPTVGKIDSVLSTSPTTVLRCYGSQPLGAEPLMPKGADFVGEVDHGLVMMTGEGDVGRSSSIGYAHQNSGRPSSPRTLSQSTSLSSKRGLNISLLSCPPTSTDLQTGHALGLSDLDAMYLSDMVHPHGDVTDSLDATDSFVARELLEKGPAEYLHEAPKSQVSSRLVQLPPGHEPEPLLEKHSELPEPSAKRFKSAGPSKIYQPRTKQTDSSSKSKEPSFEDSKKAAHYIFTPAGVYDANLDSQEDLRRESCKRVSDLHDLGSNSQAKAVEYITDHIPFHTNCEQVSAKGGEFWMTGRIIACQDYGALEKMLISGEIQAALQELKECNSQEDCMILLTLLRLVASCKTQGKLLVHAAASIYHILMTAFTQPDEHLSLMLKRRAMCDSRGYDYFLVMSLAAHSRPVQTSTDALPFDREVLYRNHAKLLVNAYGDALKSNVPDHAPLLPKGLAAHFETLTTHEMAVEIFIDIAKYGLFNIFISNYMNGNWAKVLSSYLEKKPMGQNVPYLAHLIYHAPVAIAERLVDVEKCYNSILHYYLLSLDRLISAALGQSSSQESKSISDHVRLANACGKSLISMVKAAAQYPSAVTERFIKSVRGRRVQRLSVLYVLTAPYYPIVFDTDDHKDLYETAWSFLISMSYSFPMMMSTLMDLACDPTTPPALKGHAAMFIGTTVAMTKTNITRRQLYNIYVAIKDYAAEARSSHTRHLRLEVAFRLGILLNPQKYGIRSDETNRRKRGLLAMFSSVDFTDDDEGDSCMQPKEMVVDILKLLEEDEISPLEVPVEDYLSDESVYMRTEFTEDDESDDDADNEAQDDANELDEDTD